MVKTTVKEKIFFALKVLLVAVLLAVLTVFAFPAGENFLPLYFKYLRSYGSIEGFEEAESTLNLEYGVKISSYDADNGVFITSRTVLNSYATGEDDKYILLYGMASLNDVYTDTLYTQIIEIKGDYAIVTKAFPYVDGESGKTTLEDRIGVIKFRGGNEGDRTDFSSAYMAYNSSYTQFSFLGDEYIFCPGIKSFPDAGYNFSTLYSYKKHDYLLEVAKLRNIDYSYSVALYDDYLVAVGVFGYSYFFNVKEIDPDGYLTLTQYDTYKAFPQDANDEYTDYITMDINYLGNGWFIRTATLATAEAFEGYNIIFTEYDAGTQETTTKYARLRSDLYNVKSKSKKEYDWLMVNAVANEYNRKSYTSLTDSLNNKIAADAEFSGRYEYHLPFYNPAAFVKKGYSLVYFYYFPYAESPFTYEISYCIIDSNGDLVRPEETLMPPLYIDNVGVMSSDPTFETLYGNGKIVMPDGTVKTFVEAVGGKTTYATFAVNDNIVIAEEFDLTKKTGLYGAFNADGSQVTGFLYRELSVFVGGYALGTKIECGALKTNRIDKKGREEEIKDSILAIRQGVYVYLKDGKAGLKTYGGKTLIDAEFDTADVFEVMTYGDSTLTSYAVTYKDNICYLYRLK